MSVNKCLYQILQLFQPRRGACARARTWSHVGTPTAPPGCGGTSPVSPAAGRWGHPKGPHANPGTPFPKRDAVLASLGSPSPTSTCMLLCWQVFPMLHYYSVLLAERTALPLFLFQNRRSEEASSVLCFPSAMETVIPLLRTAGEGQSCPCAPLRPVWGGWSPQPSWQAAPISWLCGSASFLLITGNGCKLASSAGSSGYFLAGIWYFLAMIKGRVASRDFSSASGTRAFVQTYESTYCLNVMQASRTHPDKSAFPVGCFCCCFGCGGFFCYRKPGFNVVGRELCRCKPHRTSVGRAPAYAYLLPFSPFYLSGRLKKQYQRGAIVL